MRTVSKMVIIVVLVLLTTPLAHAQSYTGNELVKGWQGIQNTYANKGTLDDNMKAAHYTGYVSGVVDVTRELYGLSSGVTVGQICSVVGKYLDAHPENWHLPAATLVMHALTEAFPKK